MHKRTIVMSTVSSLLLSNSALGDDTATLKKTLAIQQAQLAQQQAQTNLLQKELLELKSRMKEQPLPMTGNLLLNSAFVKVESGSPMPTSWSTYGQAKVEVEVLHPYSFGFIGPYTEERPAGARDAAEAGQATEANPVWYGRYDCGPRLSRWGWGLQDFKILKVRISGSGYGVLNQNSPNGYLSGPNGRLWGRAYVKILRGNAIGMSQDVAARALTVTKSACDASPQGWCLLDGSFTPSNTNGTFLSIGRPGGDNDELVALIALPGFYGQNPLWMENERDH